MAQTQGDLGPSPTCRSLSCSSLPLALTPPSALLPTRSGSIQLVLFLRRYPKDRTNLTLLPGSGASSVQPGLLLEKLPKPLLLWFLLSPLCSAGCPPPSASIQACTRNGQQRIYLWEAGPQKPWPPLIMFHCATRFHLQNTHSKVKLF